MQEKVECFKHHNQLRVFANRKQMGGGSVLSLQCVSYVMCEWMVCVCVHV